MSAPSPRECTSGLGRRIRAGERDAWEELAVLYHSRLLRAARAILPSSASAEDAVQATWLRALKKASSFDASKPPYPWLARICTNVSFNMRKKKWPKLFGALLRDRPGDTGLPVKACVEDVRESVEALLRRLPGREREAVTLRYLFGLSVGELALLSNRQPAAVKKALVRGLSRLRENGSGNDLRDALLVHEESL